MSEAPCPQPWWVDVPGGKLAVHQVSTAGAGAPVVLALHGITANALSWRAVGRALQGRANLYAPDLRGRAASRDITGPWGLSAHADDVVAVLDGLGVERAVLAGHSMGAFVAGLTAARHRNRVGALVLVDGGFGFPAPPGHDLDAVLEAVLGPAMQRLRMRFDDDEAYLDFWRAHPALGAGFAAPWREDLIAYLRHDLVTDPEGGYRSSCGLEAVRADGGDVLADPEVLGAVRTAGLPSTLLWAPRGLADEPQGLYDEQRLAALDLPGHVVTRRVDGANHYTVLLDAPGVAAVAQAVTDAVTTVVH